ncbi:4157_t:CDS:1, partial [Entrophospora sp. SA101]
MPPLSKIWSHFTKCNYCSHKLFGTANCCEQHLKKCTQKCCSIDIDELSEVEGNLNDEIRKVDEGSDNESNESNST